MRISDWSSDVCSSDLARAIVRQSGESASGMDALVNIIPSSIVAAMSANDTFAVMFFALFFGIGLVLVQTPNSRPLTAALEGWFRLGRRLLVQVIRIAPLAITYLLFTCDAFFVCSFLV